MASTTSIGNLSIAHLGVGKDISNLDTDTTEEAKTIRRFYDIALERMFRDFMWPFASKTYTLNLVASAPTSEWAYSYRYPPDCFFFRRICSGNRNDTYQSRVPYRIFSDSSGLLIYTDQVTAVCEYTIKVTDTTLFPSDFTMAFSYLLAYYISPRVAGVDAANLRQEMLQKYMFELELARSSAYNEEQVDQEVDSEWIRGRE